MRSYSIKTIACSLTDSALMSKAEVMRRIKAEEIKLEPITMQLGDVMIRDVRGLHRGTPNRTATPKPLVVIG